MAVLPSLWPAYAVAAPAALWANLWWMLAFGVVCLAYQGLYTRRLPFWREAKRLARACLLTFVIILGVVTLGKKAGQVSRTVLVLACAFNLFTLPAVRWLAKGLLWRAGLWARPVLVLGAGKTGELVARALTGDRHLGYRIVGFLDDDPAKRGVRANGVDYPVLGGFRDSDRVMESTGARDLIVAAPGMEPRALVGLVNRLQRSAASVTVIPDLFGVPVMGAETDYAGRAMRAVA
ncbi:MAG: hypothetical protein H5T97_14335 [Firmicutes bacterium]|nr:hypothetical protein [Bacillota bacterium]